MLFITNPHLRKLEAFMQEVPHFPPKGAKVDFDSLEGEILLFEIFDLRFLFEKREKYVIIILAVVFCTFDKIQKNSVTADRRV